MKDYKRWFQDKIGIGENRDRLDYLEKRIKLNHVLVQQLMPETLDLKVKNRPLKFFAQDETLRETNFTLHKNDLMFIGILFNHSGQVDKSLNEYFALGYLTARQLKTFAGDKKITSFLDFGGGYGRVSRFLPKCFPEATIFVSDIKKESVVFNERAFGFNGIHHSAQAAETHFNHTFDYIFAGSVFTHLPEKMAEEWLDTLCAAVNPGGVLVFSIHNIVTYGKQEHGDFYYFEHSEDSFFNWIEDSIKDTKTYGTSYISAQLATKWMESRGFSCQVDAQAFGGTQDLVIAVRQK